MEFKLDTEYIELFKLLKAVSFVGSGGEAKMLISEGMVLVNGEVETRKRYKTRVGDLVELGGERVKVI